MKASIIKFTLVISISLVSGGLLASSNPKPTAKATSNETDMYCIDGEVAGSVNSWEDYSKFACCCSRWKPKFGTTASKLADSQTPSPLESYDSTPMVSKSVRCSYHICRADKDSAEDASQAFVENFLNCYSNGAPCI